MNDALTGQQFIPPEDLLDDIHPSRGDVQKSDLEHIVHHWVERARPVLDIDGDYFHK
jgi:hypothetical protein